MQYLWRISWRPRNICSSGCPECYLWIKSSHPWSILLCWIVLLWPFVGLLLLNYALVLGHWPTLKDFIWNSYVKCILIGSVRKHREHWVLYYGESPLYENKEEIFLRFIIQNSSASTEKLIWFHIMVPVNLGTDHALVTKNDICGPSPPSVVIKYGMRSWCAYPM